MWTLILLFCVTLCHSNNKLISCHQPINQTTNLQSINHSVNQLALAVINHWKKKIWKQSSAKCEHWFYVINQSNNKSILCHQPINLHLHLQSSIIEGRFEKSNISITYAACNSCQQLFQKVKFQFAIHQNLEKICYSMFLKGRLFEKYVEKPWSGRRYHYFHHHFHHPTPRIALSVSS